MDPGDYPRHHYGWAQTYTKPSTCSILHLWQLNMSEEEPTIMMTAMAYSWLLTPSTLRFLVLFLYSSQTIQSPLLPSLNFYLLLHLANRPSFHSIVLSWSSCFTFHQKNQKKTLQFAPPNPRLLSTRLPFSNCGSLVLLLSRSIIFTYTENASPLAYLRNHSSDFLPSFTSTCFTGKVSIYKVPQSRCI